MNMYLGNVWTNMDSNDNTDANGYRYRKGGGHIIGESMPGTFGDSERVLHDKDGQTPASETHNCEVPSQHHINKETTEDNDVGVDELVKRLRK